MRARQPGYDRLAAMVTNLLRAPLLIVLSDIDERREPPPLSEPRPVQHDDTAETYEALVLGTDEGTYRARCVLLATGVVNRRPDALADDLPA